MFDKSNFIELPEEFKSAFSEEDPAPIFRKRFNIKPGFNKAVLTVCGLGYGKFYLNEITVSEDLFIAPVSNYTKTLWYNVYDVTDKIISGENIIAAMLGNGFYNESIKSAWDFNKAVWRDNLKLNLILEIFYNDSKDVIVTDETWRCDRESSPVRYNNLRSGEYYDFRFSNDWIKTDFDDSQWDFARFSKNIPKGILRECKCQPIREIKEYPPVDCFKNADNDWVIDFGQNMSGYLKIRLQQSCGDEIKIAYAEKLFADGRRDDDFVEGSRFYPESPYERDKFICNGLKNEWKPYFVYHGFRYVIINGLRDKPDINNIKAVFVTQKIDMTGFFECSDPIMNQINKMGRMSSYSNMFYMITDCPTREKLGWCNDARASAEQMLQNFDIVPLYKKWIQDMYDAMQDEGKLPGIIPTAGWGYGWGHGPLCDSAFFELPYKIYRYYDDGSALKESLPYFKRYLKFAESNANENGLIAFGLPDWAGPFKDENDRAPLDFTDTVLMSEFYRVAAVSAKLNNDSGTANDFLLKAVSHENRIKEIFIDKYSGKCKVNEQTAVAMLIVNKIYDNPKPLKEQLRSLVEIDNFHHHCGMLGMQYLYFALDICDLQEYAYKIITCNGSPSYRQWIDNGATTMWEWWKTANSKNHHMYSSVLSWFNRTVAGLNLNTHKNGFKDAIIKPFFFDEIQFCNSKYRTVSGEFVINWKKYENDVYLHFEIPRDTRACLTLSGYDCEENGKLLSSGKYDLICKKQLL